MMTEEHGIVIDFMPTGKPAAFKPEPLVQLLGKEHFTMLEASVKPGIKLTVGEEVYTGKESRDKIEIIKGRIGFKDLTSNSLAELEGIVVKMVEAEKQKYLNFYNTAKGISLKRHQLELLPGMGKKHMLAILDEREKKSFESFDEITKRVKGVPDPMKAVIKRIIEELEGIEDKHYLFVRAPAAPHETFRHDRFSDSSERFPRKDFGRKSFHA
ncbi:MAG: DUF655 domain-containing protein [Candidatus Diapherotrites archaeon]|nr:DUF655 domain-containing protein [Candidatus Diapherotrites archaeon]